jgi:hypothetical protein
MQPGGPVMSNQLDKYKERQSEIAKEFNGKIIAVKDGEVLGDYPSRADALRDMTAKGFTPGSFLIIRCTEGDEEYTATFHSRVSFKEIASELTARA